MVREATIQVDLVVVLCLRRALEAKLSHEDLLVIDFVSELKRFRLTSRGIDSHLVTRCSLSLRCLQLAQF